LCPLVPLIYTNLNSPHHTFRSVKARARHNKIRPDWRQNASEIDLSPYSLVPLRSNDHRSEREPGWDGRVETTRVSKDAPGGEVAPSQLRCSRRGRSISKVGRRFQVPHQTIVAASLLEIDGRIEHPDDAIVKVTVRISPGIAFAGGD